MEFEEQTQNQGQDQKEGGEEGSVQEIRLLIENSQVGGIIGKAGANVKKVREESGVFVSILKAEFPNVQERVLVLKGMNSQIAKGIHMVAELLVEASMSRDKTGTAVADSCSIRLLVHRSAVGAVIGKGGAVIKETQTGTGARVQVSNEALPNSTEKTVTISGNAAAIHHAFLRVLGQLSENQLRAGTKVYPYVPGQPAYSMSYGMPPPFPQNPMAGMYGAPPQGPPGAGPPGGLGQPFSAPINTQKIAIPTVCAGCVIGKGGAVIRDLRAQSQTNISIADPDGNSPNERVVTLTGTPQGIQTAIYLIRQLVEQFQPSQNF